MLDDPQVLFAAETLGIDLVNILRAGWSRSEPSAVRNHLDSAERNAVTRSGIKLCAYLFAGKHRCTNLIG